MHFSAVSCIGNTLLRENYFATPGQCRIVLLIRRHVVHLSIKTIPQSLTRTSLLTAGFWSLEFEALWQMVGLTVFLPSLVSTAKCCPATVTSFPAVFADSWRSRAYVHCNTRLRSKPRGNGDQCPGLCGLQYWLNIQRSGYWDPQYVCCCK